jgi:hypothetical protein
MLISSLGSYSVYQHAMVCNQRSYPPLLTNSYDSRPQNHVLEITVVYLEILAINNETASMSDRRRINGPPGVTRPPVFEGSPPDLPSRLRPSNSTRGICEWDCVHTVTNGDTDLRVVDRHKDRRNTLRIWVSVP